MLDSILRLSIRSRWLVLLLALFVGGLGAFALQRLPIDAVPDVTSNQVQINTLFPSLTAAEVEKQITYPLENALAGIPGLELTRSFSRNGFHAISLAPLISTLYTSASPLSSTASHRAPTLPF